MVFGDRKGAVHFTLLKMRETAKRVWRRTASEAIFFADGARAVLHERAVHDFGGEDSAVTLRTDGEMREAVADVLSRTVEDFPIAVATCRRFISRTK